MPYLSLEDSYMILRYLNNALLRVLVPISISPFFMFNNSQLSLIVPHLMRLHSISRLSRPWVLVHCSMQPYSIRRKGRSSKLVSQPRRRTIGIWRLSTTTSLSPCLSVDVSGWKGFPTLAHCQLQTLVAEACWCTITNKCRGLASGPNESNWMMASFSLARLPLATQAAKLSAQVVQ